jgi:hypothetical protein
MKYLSVLALLTVGLFFPTFSSAQGLVPVQCAGPDAAVACGTCEFVDLINNVIQFIITFSTILATIVIIYAGFRLVTSAGDVSAKEVAKRIVVNVLIGYVLILAAFLIVNTILGVLVSDGDEFGILSWQEIECIRPISPTLEAVADPEIRAFDIFEETDGWYRGVYTENDVPATRCQSTDACMAAVTACESQGLIATYDNAIPGTVECNLPAGATGGNYTGPLAQCAPGNTACNIASLRSSGFSESEANVMSCIAMTESSGNASIGPYNERPENAGSNSSACGLFQVTRTTWNTYPPGGACSDWRSSCQNAACNRQAALNLVRANGYRDWTCPNCNNRAGACVARYQ